MNSRPIDLAFGLLGRPVTRRTALGRLAGIGAALATTGLITSPVFAGQEAQGETMNQSTPTTGAPTIVLVHGGFADATSSWSGVIDRLQAGGGRLAPANPQRGIETDSAYVSNVVRTIEGPVLLVGHSYGGIVITNVGSQVDNAIGLVYVAGMAPDEGEAMLDVAADYPKTLILDALRPASVAASEAEADFVVDPAQYRAAFAAEPAGGDDTGAGGHAATIRGLGPGDALRAGGLEDPALVVRRRYRRSGHQSRATTLLCQAHGGHDHRSRRLAFAYGLAARRDRGADPLRSGLPDLIPRGSHRTEGRPSGRGAASP